MTVTQPTLDLGPVAEPVYTPGMTLDERYAAWREVNGHVVAAFEAAVTQWFRAGHEHVGAKQVAEHLRWSSGIREAGNLWKLDNSMVSRIARDLLARHPEWEGRIRTRALASERIPNSTRAESSAGAALVSG